MSAKVALYRPYLTGKEVLLIASLIQKELATEKGAGDFALLALQRKLKLFELKIGNGLISPVFKRDQTTEESLGIVKNPQEKPQSVEQDRFDTLAEKVISGTITEEEKEEGKRLEMMLYKMELGTFA